MRQKISRDDFKNKIKTMTEEQRICLEASILEEVNRGMDMLDELDDYAEFLDSITVKNIIAGANNQ